MKKNFRRTFITGLVFILPIIVTVWLIRFVFDQASSTVKPVVVQVLRLLTGSALSERIAVDYLAPLLSVILALAMIWIIGLIGGNVIGRRLLRRLENLMLQIPVVRSVYAATRQFLDTFSAAGSKAFQEVVLVEYPRRGLWSMAFVTNEATTGEVQRRTQDDVISVFIPTTPNPTSGWLLFVAKNDVIVLSMTVDEAFKMIISGGVLTPETAPRANTPDANSDDSDRPPQIAEVS
ncbi:MAG: DUF502 domain-containing protein [Myxococcota bacterium]